MDEQSNSDDLTNDNLTQNYNQANVASPTQHGTAVVQMGGQLRFVNLNNVANVRNLLGQLPNRMTSAQTSATATTMAQLLNNPNQTVQLVDGATNQVIQLTGNSTQVKLPAAPQIQLSQIRQPVAANVGGSTIQILGNNPQVLKPGSTFQLIRGQPSQVGTFQLGTGQTIQVLNTPVNGDQMVVTGGQAIQLLNSGNLQLTQQQEVTQLVRVSGTNQFIKVPVRPNNNITINTSGAAFGGTTIQVPSANVANIRANVPENIACTSRQQMVQIAVNPNNSQVTYIRPNNPSANDGSQGNMTTVRQLTPQLQKKLLLFSQSPAQSSPGNVSSAIRLPQQLLSGQQQATAGNSVRYITVKNNASGTVQVAGSTQGQQVTFSLLAPKHQQQQVVTTPIKDVQEIMQKMKEQQMKSGIPQTKVIAPAMNQHQTRFVLQAGSGANIKQAAIQVVGPGGNADSQGSAVYILTNAPGSTLTQIASSTTSSTNSNTVLKSKVLAIRPGTSSTPKTQSSSSLTSTRAAIKSNRIIEQAVAKAQAGGIEIEVTESDGKKKWKRKGEFDESSEPNKKKKKESKAKAGATDDTQDGELDEGNVEADAKSKDLNKSNNFKSFAAKNLKKKKKPPPSFMKRKRRKRDGQESDASDSAMMDPTCPSSPFLEVQDDGMTPVTTRRSGRVVQRKKYVDEIDLGLSGDESTEDVVSRRKTTNRGPPVPERNQDSQDGSIMETPMEDDFSSQVIDKILGMRINKRGVPNDVEVDEDDVDMAEDNPVNVVEVEEFFVKYKNFSYLHCAWRSIDELLHGDKRALMKIKRFKIKKSQQLYAQENSEIQEEEEELFNPDYVEVDRVLEMATTTDQEGDRTMALTHYLIAWKSLPYDEATWELEHDVDQSKIAIFLSRREKLSDEALRFKPRPSPKEWKSMEKSKIYKTDNNLREYQLEGLNWLTFCYYNKQNCILADEMGLGKTIQSITYLQEIVNYGIRGPFLVIVPLSTIGNWQREFETWTDLNAVVFHGSQASKNMLQQYEMYFNEDNGDKILGTYKFHILITTFECILSDYDVLSPIEWRVAIFDEAHRLKNRNCKLVQALSCYELEHRVLLTGTPLQNNVDELFNLLNFLEPKQFGSLEAFMSEFGRLETESEVNKLKALLKPMMLRRLKEDVEKNLAPKEETIVEVELTNIQKKYYRAILERNFVFLSKGSSSGNLPSLMNTMMELRKCCNHPYLINGAEEQILNELKVQKTDYERHFLTLVTSSGKLVLVDKLLPKLKANGHKVLIFSQMIRVLDILEDYLVHKKYLYERIDGRIRGNLRQEAIDRFSKPESDRFVFLLCTRAGGLGINLTAADTVIIFDSDWNPQNDLQAQARCHRIGQKKAVKVYRLITRNTYEREMFDKASLKLGLDKAVLQSMGNKEMNVQSQMSKKEIEDLLKKGAYGALMDDDNAGERFCEEDIEQILQRRSHVVQIESGIKGSTFAKASFNMSTNRTDIDIDDPNFWQKWARRAEIDVDKVRGKSVKQNNLIMELPRQRKTTSRYGRQDNIVNMSDLETSNSDSDYDDFNDEIEGRRGRKRKRGSKWGRDDRDGRYYTRSDCFKVEKTLLVYGWGRWKDILDHARFKHQLMIDDVITIARAMLMFSLQHYEGDEKIKKFIFDLISPEDGTEKDYKNHSGLSAPVPRGRKGKKIKKDGLKKSQLEDDLTKLDIDIDGILNDEGYRKHLIRQSNKVLLRVRLLYYLKQEVIGRNADQILEGADISEISLPISSADVDEPIFWWDEEADKSLLVGVFKHGYEKYNLMRNDHCLCFLSRCGPPDDRAVLAEQNSEAEELREEEEEDEQRPKKRGRKRKKFKKFKCNDEDDDYVAYDCRSSRGPNASGSGSALEDGKLPFPGASDLNTRFRRIITSFQRCHKQGMLKLEQVAKKLHKREQMKDAKEGGETQYVSPTHLKSVRLESVGDNPMRLAEQLNWTRREEAEFYKVVSTYGVERDIATGNYIWDTFRTLARLDKKHDDTLTEYFKAFYHMCMKVCHRFQNEEEAHPPNGMFVMTITEERANRSLARIDLLNKIRENILFHPRLDDRLALSMPASYLPSWWICGQHDKDLLIGAAKHGLSRTDFHIQYDQNLSFYKYAKQNLEEEEEEVLVKEDHIPDSIPGSPSECNDGGSKVERGRVVKYGEMKTEEEIKDECYQDGDDEKKDNMDTVDGKNLCVESVKEENDVDHKDAAAGLQSTVIGEEPVNGTSRMFNTWPKDRLIFHRLENICYCVEMGKWRMGHRHHHSSYLTGSDAVMTNDPMQSGSTLDYTFVPNNVEQMDGLRIKLQKKRYRRTKAELEAERRGYNNSDSEMINSGSILENEYIMQLKAKKKKMLLSSMEYHIPVYNTMDGTRIEGEDAPTLHELELWLEMHPEYVVDRERHKARKYRFDPSRIDVKEFTGEENVTVVNRNTGKKISGHKAPMLMDIADWLVKNPGFDIDVKWGPVLKQLHNFPKELYGRIQDPSSSCNKPQVAINFNSLHLNPGLVLSNHFSEKGQPSLPTATSLPRIIHHPKNLITNNKVIQSSASSNVNKSASAIQNIQSFGENFFSQGHQLTLLKQKVDQSELDRDLQMDVNDGNDREEEIGEEVVEEEVDYDEEENGMRCEDDEEEDEDGSTAVDEEDEMVD